MNAISCNSELISSTAAICSRKTPIFSDLCMYVTGGLKLVISYSKKNGLRLSSESFIYWFCIYRNIISPCKLGESREKKLPRRRLQLKLDEA